MQESKMYFNRGYYEKLSVEEKKNYLQKMEQCSKIDPYEIDLRNFDKINPDNFKDKIGLFPCIEHGDVINYLLFSTNFITLEQSKAYKSLEAYNFFTSGFVKNNFFIKEIDKRSLVLGEVNHSQNLNKETLKVWIISEMSGAIETTHCTCLAGLSETCSHIGAVLFAIEYINRLKNETSCTSKNNLWLPAYVKNAPLTEIRKLNFESTKRKKQKLDFMLSENTQTSNAANIIPEPTEDEITDFLRRIHNTGTKAVVLTVHPEFCDQFRTDKVLLSTSYNEDTKSS